MPIKRFLKWFIWNTSETEPGCVWRKKKHEVSVWWTKKEHLFQQLAEQIVLLLSVKNVFFPGFSLTSINSWSITLPGKIQTAKPLWMFQNVSLARFIMKKKNLDSMFPLKADGKPSASFPRASSWRTCGRREEEWMQAQCKSFELLNIW